MQEAGTVLHLARSGRLIIKATSPVREGSVLVDDKGRNAGKVLEILGPVSSPYLSAQPFTERIERLVGTKLYVSDAPPQDFRKNRRFGRSTGDSFRGNSSRGDSARTRSRSPSR
ncbi:MAG: H/ACA ribonucleoprotein complex subunit GAR1 [Nitrososphaerales archaeon]